MLVEARSVSPRTVEEREKAMAASAAESQRTARRALPLTRGRGPGAGGRGFERRGNRASRVSSERPGAVRGPQITKPPTPWPLAPGPWPLAPGPRWGPRLVGIRDPRGAQQTHGRGHCDRLQPRPIGFERGHLHANAARPADGRPGGRPEPGPAGRRGRRGGEETA